MFLKEITRICHSFGANGDSALILFGLHSITATKLGWAQQGVY